MLIQEDYFKNIFNTVREALLILDEDMRVLSANRSFFHTFKVDAANTIGSLLYDLGNGQWNIPHLRVLLEDVLPKNDTVDDYEIEHNFESIGYKTMLLNACKIREKKNDLPIILLAIEDITERKRLEDLLTESEERYRRIFETASDGIVLLEKREGHIIHANPAAEKMLGYSEEESVGKKLQDIGVSVDMSDFPAIMRSLNRSGIINYDDIQVKTKSGQYINTDIYMVDRAKLAQCNIRDVSERKQKEQYLLRMNRTLLARSKSSKAMMSARDEAWYLNEVCRIIVEDCGHALVWIGFAEQDEVRTVRPVAQCGFVEGYLDSINITWSDAERGRGPVGTAIRTGKPSVISNILSNPSFAPWREEAVKRGYASVISVPLLAEGKAFGSLNIYSRYQDPFSEDEVQLLVDLAADLSYGIAAIRQRSKQEKAESALRESEARLQTLVQTIPDLVWLKDSNGTYLACNPMFERLLGAREAEIIGRTDYDFVGRELADFFREHDRRAIAAGKPSRNEEWITFADDGHRALLDTIKTPMYDAGGNVTGVLGIARDITERKQSEEAMRESQQILEGIINAIPVRVFWKDKNLVYLGSNAAFARDAGFAAPKDIIGKDDYQMGWRDQAELYRSDDRQVIESGRSKFLIEEPQTTPEGNSITLLTSKMPLLNSHGEINGLIGTYLDITELKRAQEALFLSEKKFKDLLETINLISVMLDYNGNITFCNNYLLHLTGWTKDEVLNRNWFDLFLPDQNREAVHSMFTSGIAEGAIPLHYENMIITRDGNKKNIVWDNSLLLDTNGKVIGVASIGTDVTEHQKLEAQYLHAQKMESIGTLAGGVAHDFNNILSAIIGYGHVTLMDMAEDSPQRMNIEHILEAADRAARLTKELLLFSRKHVTERKPVDLNEVVRMVEKFLRMVIGEDIDCKTMLQERSLSVYADSHQLEQVLMNLATNARDAMPRGGALTIKVEQTDLTEDFKRAHGYGKAGPYAMITMSDTGEGMDEATQKRIFEPFFTTKDVGKGTGLGLAVVYGIIKQHDGFINVYSEPGRGTTFRIYLPLIVSKAAEETVARLEDAPARGTETVLLAEDDENLRELSRRVLAEFGYTVIVAVDGEEAVKKFMENKDTIQLLLFDLIMPKMNGKEASDEIRKIKPDIKVLFASGYDPDLLQQKALLGDGVHLVYKPISPMDLLRKIRSMLDGETQ